MKRVAFSYTGYLRTWKYCATNHWAYLFKGHDVDAYFYTYEDPEIRVNDEHGNSSLIPVHQFTKCPHPFYDDPFAPHRFDSNCAGETKPHQALNMMHNNLVGFSLIPKGYDIYVRVRPDMNFNGPLNFNEYDIQPNTVYIPKGMDYRGINDQFAFGDYDSMRKYFSVYLNAELLHSEGNLFNSEVFHLANLNKLGVNIVRIEHPQHDLMR